MVEHDDSRIFSAPIPPLLPPYGIPYSFSMVPISFARLVIRCTSRR